jgi:S1-C subfamily serine protease
MKKILLLLLVLIILVFVAQKFNIFFNPSSQTIKKQTTEATPTLVPILETDHPYIGIYYKLIDKETAALNNLAEGVYITRIIPGSPAEKVNLQEEDIIIEFDGKKIDGSNQQALNIMVDEKKPGERVALKIWRNKEIKTIFVTLETTQ